MLKKWIAVVMGAALALSLSACGNDKNTENSAEASTAPNNASSAAPSDSTAPSASASAAPVEQASEQGVPALDELIRKSAEAAKDLKSFGMDSQVSQNMTIKGETAKQQKVEMTTKSELIKEPLQMHQAVKVDSGQGVQNVEQYITGSGIYSQTGGRWLKIPAEMSKQMTASLEQSANPEAQLEQFKTIAKDTKVTEDGNNYLLTADVSGDSVKELAKSYLEQNGGDKSQAALVEQMDIKSMKLVYAVDKKTYLPTRTDVEIMMDMTNDGQSISMDTKMKTTINQHNEISKITVPEEALSAKEVEMPATK
ncbi:DUF6612 family protein [Paenibacillus sonchi]|uniref:DUF6612 family protein n=1 Tax=Paenibacillus sonchi TaxID=373687 RepID=UPI000312BD68|nr:DUF6612 family protein [Paenibacillus sonchi]